MPALRTIVKSPFSDTMMVHVPEEYRAYSSLEVIVLPIMDDEVEARPFKKRKLGGFEPKSMFGALKGKVLMSPDFDAPLEEFAEYM